MINLTFFTAIYIGSFWNLYTALAALGIGLGIATVVMLVKRSKLKSVRFERTACNYVRENSFKLVIRQDNFLFSNVTRIPRAQSSSGGRRR